jgi:soluble lytic murein transglycosylase-like protein
MLAERFGTTMPELARVNRLDPRRALLIGTRLRLPGGSGAVAAASGQSRTMSSAGTYVVRSGDSLTAIANRYGTSISAIARQNGLDPRGFLVIGTRLRVPAARAASAGGTASRDVIRASLDRWSAFYGVDPLLARALAWQESGFQNHVVSEVGARGVMQLLPVTMEFVQDVLLTQRIDGSTVDGNVQMGVRLLSHLIREWNGDLRLALAAWYQGSKAVRERGVYKVSEAFVANVLALRGRV